MISALFYMILVMFVVREVIGFVAKSSWNNSQVDRDAEKLRQTVEESGLKHLFKNYYQPLQGKY